MTWSISRTGDAHDVYASVKDTAPPEGGTRQETTTFHRAKRAVLLAMEHAAEGGSLAEYAAEVACHGHDELVTGWAVKLSRK